MQAKALKVNTGNKTFVHFSIVLVKRNIKKTGP